MKNCDFTACNLTGVDFTGCNLTGAIFLNAILAQNTFDGAKLEDIKIDPEEPAAIRKCRHRCEYGPDRPHEYLCQSQRLIEEGNTAV
ncbi:MAG: pentapeptide repeat-containing protein [Clostridia bacterium]